MSMADNILSLINSCKNEQKGFAFFRLPYDNIVKFIFGEIMEVKSPNEIKRLGEGYYMQPFQPTENGAFIKSEQNFELSIDDFDSVLIGIGTESFYSSSEDQITTTEASYINYVDQTVEEIKTGNYKKIVCANQEQAEKNNALPIQAFIEGCKQHDHAFVALHSTPKFGTWCGISPELLLEVNKGKLHTVALAGTQLKRPEINEETAAWTQKEIEEQALVSRYIINCFKTIRLREFEEEGPKTVQAGNLLHLKTDFSVHLSDTDIRNLPFVLLPLLHPTSAVCGMPREKSLNFITQNEGFDRSLYAGYHGPVYDEEQMHLFVNLRCAQIKHNEVIYYAGAGVTSNSDSEKEWIETQNKKIGMKELV